MAKPNAYLEKAGDEWLDDFVYISKQALIERGYKVIPFDGSDMENTLLNKSFNVDEDLIIGSVQATEAYFRINNISIPKSLSYPKSLKKYLGRDIVETTFGELDNNFPYFVKPSGQVKLFTGGVIESKTHLGYLETFDKCKADTKVFKSEVMEFVSEFRCFVLSGELKGIQYYLGDFTVFPDVNRIARMIASYNDCPSAYTLDVGVSNDGKTYLVEVNDMWAIGSYGFNSKDYVLACARRMKEIIRENKIK
jgi:hypothetical protein